MKRKRKAIIALVMAICMVFLTSCGSSSTVSGDGTQKESCVTVGISGTPDLDPAIANTGSSLIAMVNLYDTLVYPGADGGVEPRIAESWETSDDGLTYTFKIKSGIKFHDGSELTAEDVKFSMDRLLTIGEGYAYVFEDAVDSTEATDDTTVVFHLKKAFGAFPDSLIRLYILNKDLVMSHLEDGSYGENKDYGKSWLVTHDAGSGAYEAKELVQQDYFYAEKYDDWFMGWDNENAPEAFKLMAITEASTVRTMMSNRELDITDQWQSSETLTALSKLSGVSIGEFSTYLEYNLYFNTKLAPMDDLNFRRAMCCLIDYDTICESIFIDSVKSTGPVSASVNGHADTTTYKFDEAKAKEYLAASKYADNYKDYPVEILCNSDVPDLEKVALLIQQAAADVGITIEISKAPWVSIIDRMGSEDTTPQMLAINSSPCYNDAGAYLESRYSSKTAGTWEQGEWLQDTELDASIADAIATQDQTERYEKYATIQSHIVDDLCPTAYLCDLTERVAYQSDYLTWPAIEKASDGTLASAPIGYLHAFANMELHLDKK